VIGQCLTNKNESATVAKKQKILQTKQGLCSVQKIAAAISQSYAAVSLSARATSKLGVHVPGLQQKPCRTWDSSSGVARIAARADAG